MNLPKNGNHGPRVKPVMNPRTMKLDQAGTLKLCDDWEYTPGKDDKHVSSSDIRHMKEFFRKYLILLLLVWDKHANDPDLGYYLQGQISLSEFIENLEFYLSYQNELDEIETVAELEQFCRDNNLVNMYRN